MTHEKDVEDMPNAQGDLGPMINDINGKVMKHTEQIARLETQNENIFSKLSTMENKVDEVGSKVDEGNKKNETIFNQLLDHHLGIRKSNNANKWKIVGAALGGGGVISAIVVALIQLI